MARCTAIYGATPTLRGRPIRCEYAAGHDGRHGHSFAARYWDDAPSWGERGPQTQAEYDDEDHDLTPFVREHDAWMLED